MDASVVWPQKGFLFIPLENSCTMSVTASDGLSCSASSETNAELVAPSFHIRYAPFYFQKKYMLPFFLSMNVDVRRNLKNMEFCSPRRQLSEH